MSALLRVLMGQATSAPVPPGDIVTEGLVFRLNGMNQGNITDAWVDEIGGLVFNYFGNGIEKLSNGVRLPGIKGSCLECNTDNLFNTKNSTIEICVNMAFATSRGNALFMQSQPDNEKKWTLVIGGNKTLWVGNRADTYNLPSYPLQNATKFSLSVTEQTAMQNNIKLISNGTDYNTSRAGNKIRIGESAYNFGNFLEGVVHEVRIYNRVLTDDERAFNYQHDKSTYLEV